MGWHSKRPLLLLLWQQAYNKRGPVWSKESTVPSRVPCALPPRPLGAPSRWWGSAGYEVDGGMYVKSPHHRSQEGWIGGCYVRYVYIPPIPPAVLQRIHDHICIWSTARLSVPASLKEQEQEQEQHQHQKRKKELCYHIHPCIDGSTYLPTYLPVSLLQRAGQGADCWQLAEGTMPLLCYVIVYHSIS